MHVRHLGQSAVRHAEPPACEVQIGMQHIVVLARLGDVVGGVGQAKALRRPLFGIWIFQA
jgi:hypothetical protein